MKNYYFKKALPVWEKDKSRTMNYNLVFRCIIPRGNDVHIAISASSMYQLFVNGTFAGEGPARAGHGYYRVDEINLDKYLTDDSNIVAVYVDGYYVENFYLIKQPSFFCAEVISDGEVIAATGSDGFEAKYHADRIRKAVRFSYQRTFAEAYRFDEGFKDFECKTDAVFSPVELEVMENKKFIERGVPYPAYKICCAEKIISRGNAKFSDVPYEPNRARYIDLVSHCAGFALDELDIINSDEIDKGTYTPVSYDVISPENHVICANGYAVYSLPCEKTGFVRLEVEAESDVCLMAAFDEISVNSDVSTKRFPSVQGSIIWNLKKGSYTLLSNEPYSMKYLKIINRSDGMLRVKSFGIVEFAFDVEAEPLNSGNKKLDKIYDAAVETFKQNTLDIYMDCPSRERAGWLCDSFFTARVENELTGKSDVEKNFLENFIIAEGFSDIDSRMLPMCYPSDFLLKQFIPNWAMWYVLELEEYVGRTGDTGLAEYARERLTKLAEYFCGFENSDGLLENLESWVFLEWSKANEFTQNVNYPSNMLYARMLRSMGALYGGDYASKAEKIEKAIRAQSYFDGFFHDHAVREADGRLTVAADDITETCQYYAFFTGVASKEMYPELWKILLEDFGSDRLEKGLWKNIWPSNAFIGYYLRLEILARENEKQKLLSNIEDFFFEMAETTGTLWENNTPTASCNHGFASHVIVWLDKFAREDNAEHNGTEKN